MTVLTISARCNFKLSREGLSISFNYRARFSSDSPLIAHMYHHLLVLLGHRPSFPSRLRRILLSPTPHPTISDLSQKFPPSPSSPGYVTFCTPDDILIIEKDLKTAKIITSNEFLAVTNHDQIMESWSSEQWVHALTKEGFPGIGAVREILEDSVARKERMSRMWRSTSLKDAAVDVEDVKTWLTTEPIVNELTHFSCIMDPAAQGGGLVWVRAYDS